MGAKLCFWLYQDFQGLSSGKCLKYYVVKVKEFGFCGVHTWFSLCVLTGAFVVSVTVRSAYWDDLFVYLLRISVWPCDTSVRVFDVETGLCVWLDSVEHTLICLVQTLQIHPWLQWKILKSLFVSTHYFILIKFLFSTLLFYVLVPFLLLRGCRRTQ